MVEYIFLISCWFIMTVHDSVFFFGDILLVSLFQITCMSNDVLCALRFTLKPAAFVICTSTDQMYPGVSVSDTLTPMYSGVSV